MFSEIPLQVLSQQMMMLRMEKNSPDFSDYLGEHGVIL